MIDMASDNELLHEIASELGDETTGVKPNNYWLKKILDGIKNKIKPPLVVEKNICRWSKLIKLH